MGSATPAPLLEQAADIDALWDAWIIAQSRARTDQGLSRAARRFMKTAGDRIPRMSGSLREGTYRPHRLHVVEVAKADGGVRHLSVPSMEDRIVERSVLDVVNGHVDRHLGVASFAYRPGLGVADAVRRVCELRDEGLGWVARTDIEDCFDTVPRDVAVDALLRLLPDDSLRKLIVDLAGRKQAGRHPRASGIPQGTGLSPLLLNVLLAPVDDRMLDEGYQIVRYADDIVLLGERRVDAEDGLRLLDEELKMLGMKLNGEKTRTMDFRDGFVFLGEAIGERYPADEESVEPPRARRLYVARQGAWCGIVRGRIQVRSPDDEVLEDVAKNDVGGVIAFGSVGVSAGLREWCMRNGIPVVYMSRYGRYQGQLIAADAGTRIPRLVAQLRVAEDENRSLGFAREAVASKIRNQMVLLRRFTRRSSPTEVVNALHRMREILADVPGATTRNRLMGLEGAAAGAYFPAYGALFPEEFRTVLRSRRPPKDPVNSCLGYAYAVLESECTSALISAGLEPSIGFLHVAGERRRRSLALDLMEEFRPYVVDQAVLSMFRRGVLEADDFREEKNGAVLLTPKGKSELLRGLETRLLQQTSGALPKFSGSIRAVIYRQAERLAVDCDSGGVWTWNGISWR